MLRRPLVISAAAFAAGIWLFRLAEGSSEYLLPALAWTVPAGGLFLFCLYLLRGEEGASEKARRAGALVLVFLLAGMLRGALSFGQVSQFAPYSGQVVQVPGRIIQATQKDEDTVTAVLSLAPGEAAQLADGTRLAQRRERLLLTLTHCGQKPAALVGRRVTVRGTVEEPAGPSNPGAFDYGMYLRARKILCTMRAEAGALEERGRPEGVWRGIRAVCRAKEAYEERLFARMDAEAAGMLCGILFGDGQYMDASVRESFGENGIGHLLAASGLHTGFVYALLFALCGRPRTLGGNLPILGALGVYALLADGSASVLRAVLMIAVRVVGQTRLRRTDFLTNVALCGWILLLYEPANLFSSGFQLSFAAALSLAVLLPGVQRLTAGWFAESAAERAVAADGFEGRPLRDDGPDDEDLPQPLWERLFTRLWTGTVGTVALQAGMAPAILHSYHYVSIGGLLLNIPAIALAGLLVPAGLALLPVNWLLEQAAQAGLPDSANALLAVPLCVLEMLCRLLLWMNGFLSAGGRACVYLPSPPAAVFFAYYALLFLGLSEAGARFFQACRGRRHDAPSPAGPAAAPPKSKAAPGGALLHSRAASDAPPVAPHRSRTAGGGFLPVAAALLAVLCFCAGAGVLADKASRDADLIFLDVGQGDCAHLKAGGQTVLFDSGGSDRRDIGKDVLMPYLLGSGAGAIDLAVISHLHTDHYAGLCSVKDYLPVRWLALSAAYRSLAEQVTQETGVPEEHLLFLEEGDRFTFGGATFTVLAPEHRPAEEFARMARDEKEENNCSLVIRADYKGASCLFTGDISSELEQALARREAAALDCDVLKVAHHGSKYSSCAPFLEAVSPALSVIQVGAHNLYGHPTPEALDRLAAAGSRITRTDQQGAILLDLDAGLQIHTMKNIRMQVR